MGEKREVAKGAQGPVEAAPTLLGATMQAVVTGDAPTRSSGVRRAEAPCASPLPDVDGDRYVDVRELGRGGMGRVDEVFDGALGRTVARKALLDSASAHAASLLIAEAQTAAQLEHPSIVPVYDVGTTAAGEAFYTMRVVRGRTLRRVLDPASLERPSLTRLLGILRHVCLAVSYAHSRGVVHRDLKPDNIIVGEFGEVYVLDWGVAVVTDGSDIRRAASEQYLAGSPGYMAPEQVVSEKVDARADIFALGVMLYEILSGHRPFDDGTVESVTARLKRDVSIPPSGGVPGVPTAFDGLTLSCLARDPSHRPASASVIVDAIDEYLDIERQNEVRSDEARALTAEGEAALASYLDLEARSQARKLEGEEQLAAIPSWAPPADKETAWEALAESARLAQSAARSVANAESAFSRALSRIADHEPARRGLARLHFHQFVAAEADGDHDAMTKHLALARTYDDGSLSLELADEGTLDVETLPTGEDVRVAPIVSRGPLLVEGPALVLGRAPTVARSLASGSWIVTVGEGERTRRHPIVVRRAQAHRLTSWAPPDGALPDGMIHVPGGPFRAALDGRGLRFGDEELPDFAIGRFPVTLREYGRFLDSLPDDERKRRTRAWLVRDDGGYRLDPDWVAGVARARVPPDRELDLPVHDVTWWDAFAYVRWLARISGRPYRLPTDREWDKATRGADGRLFPMGNALDASFAKLRDSRPEFAQLEPVGNFPLDVSPYGVRDLAGSVGDWTATMEDRGPIPEPSDEGTRAIDERAAIWRGGTWSMAFVQRTALRYTQMIGTPATWIGFRVALSLPGGASKLATTPLDR
jgi:eukaryotic-like serine/threonine-protein kinase